MTLEAAAITPATDVAVQLVEPSCGTVEAPADATYGWEMFVAFVAAVLGLSIAVAVLALVGSWWMLGIAVLAQLSVTVMMIRLVFGAFGSEDHAYPDGRRAEAVSRAALAV
ncbi:MAG: hypothetical protein ACRDLT_16435 [Solirubrobacteraceae bacterium]